MSAAAAPDESSGQRGFPAEIVSASREFPLFAQLESEGMPALSGVTIGWHCHLTWLTAIAARTMLACGARLVMSECNSATSESAAVSWMRDHGAVVYLGPHSARRVLEHRPAVISDTGLVLLSACLDSGEAGVFAACEITTSGIERLRALPGVPLPVVNINDGRLKRDIENFHGVGGGVVESIRRLCPGSWQGKKAAVAGYGSVGSGVARYLASAGWQVMVVECDPVRALTAHYDGFVLAGLESALSMSNLIVTATGKEGLLGRDEWLLAGDGLVVLNVGHWPGEVSPDALAALAVESRQVSDHLEEFVVEDGRGKRSLFLACGGSPANVAMLTGSAQPTLIHLATESLTLAYLLECRQAGVRLSAGEMRVPEQVERQVSLLALAALGETPLDCRIGKRG